jgi:type VI secretion system protein ImpA
MIDYDQIITPINGVNPCGVDVRQDSNLSEKYLALRDLRSSLRKEERRRLETDGVLAPDQNSWQKIIHIANNILVHSSKDIELSIWLLEGMTRVEGINGLKISLDIICNFLEQYDLKELHPQQDAEDDEMDNILAPIILLSGRYEAGTLIAPIYFCPVIQTMDGTVYSGWDVKKILQDDTHHSGNKELTKECIIKSEVMRGIILDIDIAHFSKLKSSLTEGIESFKKFNSLLTEKFGRQAPNLDNIKEVLNYCYNLVSYISKFLQDNSVASSDQKNSINENKPQKNSKLELGILDYTMLDKESASQLIEVLIKFFSTSEPHSPIAASLSRTLKWSKSSLPEILCDLIPDDDARSEYCSISGIPFI